MQFNFLIFLWLATVSTSGFSETMEDLVLKDGRFHEISNDQPFNGEIKGQDNGFFRDGLRHGAWVFFYDSGKMKSQGEFKNGQKHGSWIGFYANGRTFYKGRYVDGKKQGLWISYYDDETLFYQGNFENGREDGVWLGFNPDGTPWNYRTGNFKNGTKMSD
jgi:antitoxin component YwqK of YwqJK toxin-antitoxin module